MAANEFLHCFYCCRTHCWNLINLFASLSCTAVAKHLWLESCSCKRERFVQRVAHVIRERLPYVLWKDYAELIGIHILLTDMLIGLHCDGVVMQMSTTNGSQQQLFSTTKTTSMQIHPGSSNSKIVHRRFSAQAFPHTSFSAGVLQSLAWKAGWSLVAVSLP